MNTSRTHNWLRIVIAVVFLISARARAAESESAALHPAWAPVLAPVSLLVPGTSHWIRGETETAKALLQSAGISLGTFVGLGALGAYTGAAYALMIPSIPILLVAGSGYLAAGSADFIGSFSPPSTNEPTHSPIGRESDGLANFSYLYVPNEIFEEHHYYRVGAVWNLDNQLLSASLMSDSKARNVFYEGSFSYPIHKWGENEKPARLYLDLGALHEQNPDSMYDATRLQSSLLTRIPLAIVARTLSSAHLELSVGYQYRWTHYDDFLEAPTDYQSGVNGGFEIGWRLMDHLHLSWGYEHSRDGLIGGLFTGYLGHFHAGGGIRITPSNWLTGKVYAGKPVSFSIGWEGVL